MPENPLDPGFVKVRYAVTFGGVPRQHVQILPVKYFDPNPSVGVSPLLMNSLGSSVTVATFVSAYKVVWGAFMGTAAEIQSFEFWKDDPSLSVDPVWIWTEAAGTQPTLSGTSIAMSQTAVTFRTLAGGIAKYYFMEGKSLVNARDAYPFAASSPQLTLSNYVLGNTSPIIGRDNSFPIVGIAASTKTSDALRKKYLLNE